MGHQAWLILTVILLLAHTYTYGPESLIDREVVISRWGSRASSGAQLGARWFKTVGGHCFSQSFFLAFSFLVIQSFKSKRLMRIVETHVA